MSVSKQKRDWKWPAALLVTVALTLPVLAAFAYAPYYQRQYWDYVGHLSDSTVYAYRNDGLRVIAGEESLTAEGDAVYALYNAVWAAGKGRPQRKTPQRAPDVKFSFGDGSFLSAWGVPVKNSRLDREDGVLILFTGKGGYSYCYDTDMLSIGRVRELYFY